MYNQVDCNWRVDDPAFRIRIGLVSLALASDAIAPLGTYTETERKQWAFVKRATPAVPAFTAPADKAWVKNPVDAFILSKLQQGGPEAVAAGGPQDAAAPGLLRPDRLAAHARRNGRFPGRQIARRLCQGRREAAGQPAIRRALGPALAGRGPVRRDRWLRVRYPSRRCLAVPRLRDPRLQQRQAVRPLRDGAARGRRNRAQGRRDSDRRRLQPSRPGSQERREPGSRQQPQRDSDRDDEHRRGGVPGRHGRLRALPRSQVRPDPAERLLPPAGVSSGPRTSGKSPKPRRTKRLRGRRRRRRSRTRSKRFARRCSSFAARRIPNRWTSGSS